MVNTERLPRVEAEFNVIAPEGGFRRRLRSLDLREQTYLDLEIVNPGYGISMWLRVFPNTSEVVLHPQHSELYIFNHASAKFITRESGEEVPNRPELEVWASINTAVQVEGEPAGTLKMWELSFDPNEMGA